MPCCLQLLGYAVDRDAAGTAVKTQEQRMESDMKIYETASPGETRQLGYDMGKCACAGQVYCLDGDLGTGKTVFAQGFAAGLGIEEPVNSPTFTIVQ